MNSDVVAQLRAELATLEGPARMPVLVRLGQALTSEYNRIGPGTPAARPALDASIDALAEAHGHLDATDPLRRQVAWWLGFLLAARYSIHGGSDRDRDAGIGLLEEALLFPGLSPAQRATIGINLAHLLFGRVLAYLQSGAFSIDARAGRAGAGRANADMDRASAQLRAVIDGESVSDELTVIARTLFELVEALRAVLATNAHGPARLDLHQLTAVLARMEELQDRVRRQGPVGYRVPTGDMLPLGMDLAARDPLDRPVAVVHGAPPAGAPAPVIERPAPPPPPDVAELRRAVRALLPPADGAGPEPEWLAAARLLRPDTPAPDAATVDEMVALATTIVELVPPADRAGEADRSVAAVDAYLLAVALWLRDRAAADPDGPDRRAGADELLAAARLIPLDHPAAPVILRSLGAFLSETGPLDSVAAAIGGGFADRLDAAIAAGVAEPADLVTLHALRCLCRAAEALADLRRATGAVPMEYPWLAPLKAAGELADSTLR